MRVTWYDGIVHEIEASNQNQMKGISTKINLDLHSKSPKHLYAPYTYTAAAIFSSRKKKDSTERQDRREDTQKEQTAREFQITTLQIPSTNHPDF